MNRGYYEKCKQISENGNVYTLGETVLQTLIDDGVPFDDRDIANVNNNISANNQSQGFRIEYKRSSTQYIGDYGYDIEFINGAIRYVTIDFKP